MINARPFISRSAFRWLRGVVVDSAADVLVALDVALALELEGDALLRVAVKADVGILASALWRPPSGFCPDGQLRVARPVCCPE
jgi:hypothetical protein